MSANPSTGSGWKDNHWLNRTYHQMFDSTEIEKNGYYVQDILISKENSTLKPISREGNIIELFEASSNRSIEIQSYYLNNLMGMVHILKPKSGVIGKDLESSLNLQLNNSVSHYILICDPKIAITTANHGIVPKLFVILQKGSGKSFLMFKVTSVFFLITNNYNNLDMQSVRHENINRPQNPCEEDPQYNFAYCLEKSIVTRAGCQPYWSKYNVSTMPFCSNTSMLQKYSDVSLNFSKLYKNELIETSKCLRPCSFTEYKVILFVCLRMFI